MLYPCGSRGPFQGYCGLFFYPSRRSLLVSGVRRVVGWCVDSVLAACVFGGRDLTNK